MNTTDWRPLRNATGEIKTDSPGREGATLVRFLDATFTSGFDRSCPGGAQGVWTDVTGAWVVTMLVGLDRRGMAETGTDSVLVEFYGDQERDLYVATDASDCPIVYTALQPEHVAGTVDCTGLRWFNGYELGTEPESADPLPGIAPFALHASFDGRP